MTELAADSAHTALRPNNATGAVGAGMIMRAAAQRAALSEPESIIGGRAFRFD